MYTLKLTTNTSKIYLTILMYLYYEALVKVHFLPLFISNFLLLYFLSHFHFLTLSKSLHSQFKRNYIWQWSFCPCSSNQSGWLLFFKYHSNSDILSFRPTFVQSISSPSPSWPPLNPGRLNWKLTFWLYSTSTSRPCPIDCLHMDLSFIKMLHIYAD